MLVCRSTSLLQKNLRNFYRTDMQIWSINSEVTINFIVKFAQFICKYGDDNKIKKELSRNSEFYTKKYTLISVEFQMGVHWFLRLRMRMRIILYFLTMKKLTHTSIHQRTMISAEQYSTTHEGNKIDATPCIHLWPHKFKEGPW